MRSAGKKKKGKAAQSKLGCIWQTVLIVCIFWFFWLVFTLTGTGVSTLSRKQTEIRQNHQQCQKKEKKSKKPYVQAREIIHKTQYPHKYHFDINRSEMNSNLTCCSVKDELIISTIMGQKLHCWYINMTYIVNSKIAWDGPSIGLKLIASISNTCPGY